MFLFFAYSGLLGELHDSAHRVLKEVAKLLQKMANFVLFDLKKDPSKQRYNDFITEETPSLKAFLTALSDPALVRDPQRGVLHIGDGCVEYRARHPRAWRARTTIPRWSCVRMLLFLWDDFWNSASRRPKLAAKLRS